MHVTPRRCQRFKPQPGDRFRWTLTRAGDGRPLQAGTAVADRWGLVTVRDVTVARSKSRLRIAK